LAKTNILELAKHLKQGQQAEKLVEQYLRKNGYLIYEKNFRSGRSEVDIIGEKDGLLIFFEVKSLQGSFYGNPEESITEHKKRMLFEAANAYQIEKNWDQEIRFDAISVNFYPQAIKIEHFEDAFS
jgi:putative endonuclease